MVDRLVVGTVWVNCYYVREFVVLFGGVWNLGIGREGGMWSFDFFCDVKNIVICYELLWVGLM